MLVLPLIQSPPTNWGTLLSALLQCQQISCITAPGMKTIVTLDMQLHIKAVQIVDTRPELKDKFILRIGELHELFAQCRCIGKLIEDSGLDSLFVHSEIFGPGVVAKIHEKMCQCCSDFVLLHLWLVFGMFLVQEHRVSRRIEKFVITKTSNLIKVGVDSTSKRNSWTFCGKSGANWLFQAVQRIQREPEKASKIS